MKKILTLLSYILFSGHAWSQFNIPQIPIYDSLVVKKEIKGNVYEKNYFKNNMLILEIHYISYGRLGVPFSNGYTEDSCYAFIKNDIYDVYLFASDYIINEKYSLNSNIYNYSKYSRPDNKKIEDGN